METVAGVREWWISELAQRLRVRARHGSGGAVGVRFWVVRVRGGDRVRGDVRRDGGAKAGWVHATAINTLVAGVYGTNATNGTGATGAAPVSANVDVERASGDDGQGADSLTETLFDEGFDAFVRRLQERPLREHIGHTPVQVVAGAVTGVVIGVVISVSMIVVE